MADQAPWRRQTLGNQMPTADYADNVSAGGPPPPPPPPLALGAVPAVRLKAEISERRPEPPACVQNAMMTKDKKPFTYTPGGIDLSQIRSPRMARRITRNANAEGVQPDAGRPAGPPQHGPLPPSALAAMQPQLPVQVFPTGGGGPPAAMAPPPPPPPPPVPGPGPAPPIMSQPPSAKAPSPPNSNSQMPYVRPDIKIPENPMGLLRKTGGPHRTQPDVTQPSVQPVQAVQPPQAMYKPAQPSVTSPVQVVQPPQPQPVYKSVQPPVTSPVQAMPQPVYQPRPAMAVSPEQKQENRQQVGSIYIPPLNSEEMQKSPSTPQKSLPDSPGSPMDTLKKAPTPWLTGRVQPKPQDPPAWARSPPESVASSTPTTPATPSTPGTPGATRVIPIRIERSEDAKDIQQQQQQQMYQQQQRQQQQYQQQMQQQMMQQYRQQQQQQQQFQQQPTHSVRMIPIQIEGQMTHVGPMSPSGNMATPDLMGAPVQSPTFRILQRVTSRDEELHSHPAIHHPPSLGHAFPVEQMRKMQLTEDEKALMNRVRNQVPRAVIINRGPQGGIRKTNSPRTPDGEGALPPSEQRVPEPRKYTGSAIPSRSFQMLQAMVAPENCANGSETDDNTSYPYDPNMYPWGYNPMYPPPPAPYWNDPYWGYYATDAYPTETVETVAENETGTETPTVENITERNCETPASMSQDEYYGQMPYWDPYYAYYAAYYGYYPPHAYSPHAFYPSNETDDYSSNDEMAYYGARFPPGAVPCGHESVPPAQEQVTPTDTEVEEITEAEESSERQQAGTLQAIKSVSDIQVYNENGNVDESSTTEEEVESSESDEEEEDDDSDSTEDGADDSNHLPHQLSVILEESELSEAERRRRETSVATTISEDDSSTTIGGDSLDEQDMEEATVTVRLPLKLKFGVSEDGKEGVTEVIVGDSELQHHTPDTSVSVTLNIDAKSDEQQQQQQPSKSAAATSKQQIRSPFCRQTSEETENYETAEDTDAHDDTRENSPVQSADEYEDGDTDFWDEIEKKVKSEDEAEVPQDKDDESDAESITKVEIKDKDNVKETLVPNDVEEKARNDDEVEEDDEDDDDDDDESSDSDENDSDNEETDDCKLEKDLRDAFASDAVKERVRALRETGKARIGEDPKEEAVSVRQRIQAIENGGSSTGATSASRSSSMKGCDFSEEDGDSGVTSDVSRHTDTESDYFAEQLLKRYQRASTHSRLFKLLQDECSKSDDEDDDEEEDDVELRRKKLSLPLSGSEPESGICSPASPIWLARELVHGLLGGRRGRKYKSLPVERLYAAAQRILQEDARSNTSEDGSPMESYAADYRSYYSSWEDAGSRCSSAMKKRIARCPRVKSEKNVPARVAETEESEETDDPCPILSQSESRQQVTSAS